MFQSRHKDVNACYSAVFSALTTDFCFVFEHHRNIKKSYFCLQSQKNASQKVGNNFWMLYKICIAPMEANSYAFSGMRCSKLRVKVQNLYRVSQRSSGVCCNGKRRTAAEHQFHVGYT